jgi:putative flavoprotein involved in K+ transport
VADGSHGIAHRSTASTPSGAGKPGDEQVVIVGAGPCGLAVARQLKHEQGIDALVVDRAAQPASSWRKIYDGFRLNTCGYWSHLPGQYLPRGYGRWPTRDDMVDYFDDYALRQRLRLRLDAAVSRLDRDPHGWRVAIDGETLAATAVVVATGNYRTPKMPLWPGTEEFTGDLLHSADYRSAQSFVGCDVLVVGCGNSATDIVLQLSGGIASRVRMSVRTPPHLVPRAMAGVPIDAFSDLFTYLPVTVLDHCAALMRKLRFGDLNARGLAAPSQGIYTALLEDGRIPTLGDELVPSIEDGSIEVVAAVESFSRDGALLVDGSVVDAVVVIAATGYRQDLEYMVGHLDVLNDEGKPLINGTHSAARGLWFAGYDEPLIGPLRSFRRGATPLAGEVAAYLADGDCGGTLSP